MITIKLIKDYMTKHFKFIWHEEYESLNYYELQRTRNDKIWKSDFDERYNKSKGLKLTLKGCVQGSCVQGDCCQGKSCVIGVE